MKKSTVRIVGGQYRRSIINVPDIPGLRPSPDRVRETLFNWVNHLWEGVFDNKRVLDLFAGCGALGFEAASRGVAHVQMVEININAVNSLRTLRTKLNATNVRIHHGDALDVISRLRTTPFDLIFLDPPFNKNLLLPIFKQLHCMLGPESLVYIESESDITPPDWLQTIRSSKAGRVHFQLCTFAALQNK